LSAGYHVSNISIDTYDVVIDAYCGYYPDSRALREAVIKAAS
jgi:hypothetical protein